MVVPAHNEEGVIAKTLESLRVQIPSKDIYVVDDGSQDLSSLVAARYTKKVLTLKQNVGKAGALNAAIQTYNLVKKYDLIMFMDADTQVGPEFTSLCVSHFAADTKGDLACVVGRVQGLGGSWVGKYRLWEYAIAHSIHKRAQANLNSILVVPGCATVYRSDIFENITIPAGTFTEDMDFTFLLHRSKHSRMIFEEKAVVYTQDPQTLKSFIKQVSRWYVGFWQAVKKHDLPWHGQNLDFEATLLATEGLFSGLITVALLLFFPLMIIFNALHILMVPVLFDLFVFFLPSLVWSSIKSRDYTLVGYIPHFYFLRLLTSLLFLFSFFRAAFVKRLEYTWDTTRFVLE